VGTLSDPLADEGVGSTATSPNASSILYRGFSRDGEFRGPPAHSADGSNDHGLPVNFTRTRWAHELSKEVNLGMSQSAARFDEVDGRRRHHRHVERRMTTVAAQQAALVKKTSVEHVRARLAEKAKAEQTKKGMAHACQAGDSHQGSTCCSGRSSLEQSGARLYATTSEIAVPGTSQYCPLPPLPSTVRRLGVTYGKMGTRPDQLGGGAVMKGQAHGRNVPNSR